MATSTDTSRQTRTAPARSPLYGATIGLTALAVLLQGVWAGYFLEGEGPRDTGWVSVHATGGEVAIGLAALSTVIAFVMLRSRKDLWLGSAVLTVLLVLESYIGGLVSEGNDGLTPVHIPIAMALMGLVVWLPFRATRTPAAG